MAEFNIRFYVLEEGEAIHYRHHDIAYNKLYTLFFQPVQCLGAITCHQYIIVLIDLVCDESTHFLIVFNDQDGRTPLFAGISYFSKGCLWLRFLVCCLYCSGLFYRQGDTEHCLVVLEVNQFKYSMMHFG